MAPTIDQDSTSQFDYTPSYSEENVYLLCKKLSEDGVADVSDLFVVFVSNEAKKIPVWNQKATQRSDGRVVRDYHVFCIQSGKEEKEDLVWDLDSKIPSPCSLSSYISESIQPSYGLLAEFQRIFRVVHAPVYLRHFASDRRHMKVSEGNWKSPPPESEVIVAKDGTEHNLNQYTDMLTKDLLKDIEKDSIGAVFTEQLGVLVGENQLEPLFSCISQ